MLKSHEMELGMQEAWNLSRLFVGDMGATARGSASAGLMTQSRGGEDATDRVVGAWCLRTISEARASDSGVAIEAEESTVSSLVRVLLDIMVLKLSNVYTLMKRTFHHVLRITDALHEIEPLRIISMLAASARSRWH